MILVNPEVRKACAKGLYHMNQLTAEGLELGIKFYKEAIDIDPADPEPYIGLARGYASAGHGTDLNYIGIADIYAALGDTDKAIHWIEEAYKEKHDFIPWVRNNPYYRKFDNDPRFQDIVARLNLPE